MNKMRLRFKEEFPSLKYSVREEEELNVDFIDVGDVEKHCLDKQRVKKAIEKCTHHVWGTILPNELFKELGMEK